MKTLKPKELKSLEQFFQLSQASLLTVMRRYLLTKYKKVYCTQDYICAIGDIPVALVAHLDTVFNSPPERIFYDREKNVMWSPEGLGADDRAGVYSIVQILKQGYRPTVILTTDEEKGALGADKLIRNFLSSPTELKYMIQLDRRGSIDCVFYDCNNPEFEEYVESFGFVTNFGTFSDISVICPQWKVAGVNLSIGYYDEHSYSETLYVGQMNATINKVIKMLEDADKAEIYQYIPATYSSYYKGFGFSYPDDDFGWDPAYGVSKEVWKSWYSGNGTNFSTGDTLIPCHICGEVDYEYNLFPTKSENGGTLFLCSDCISDAENRVEWCELCKEPFMLKENDKIKNVCYDCRKSTQGVK